MSNELVHADAAPRLWITSIAELASAAKSMTPYAGKGATESDCGMKLMLGQSLGLDVCTSLAQIHIVQGRPTLGATAQLVLAHRAGVDSHWVRTDAERAELQLRAPRREPFTCVFTIEDARRAGLASKDTWKSYPAEMLRARCITTAIRAYCPEVLGGVVYDREEIESLPEPQRSTQRSGERRSDIIEGEVVEQTVEQTHGSDRGVVGDSPKKGKGKPEPQVGTVQQLLLVVEQVLEKHGLELPLGPQDSIANVRDVAELLSAKAKAEAKVGTIDELSPATLGGLIGRINSIDAGGLKSRLGVSS